MKIVPVILSIFLFGACVFAQKAACDLTIERAPSFMGLRLGQSEQDAAKLVGGTFGPEEENPRYLRELRVFKDQDPQFEYITGIRLLSFDGTISRIQFDYDEDEWPSAKAAAESVAPGLGLPITAFKIDRFRGEATMTCKDFTIDIDRIGQVTFQDTTVYKRVTERDEADKKKAKQ